MKKLALIMLVGALAVVSSCTKKGDRGPQGPQGNANVVGTNSFVVGSGSANDWDKSSDGVYYATFSNSAITQDIADYGVVEIFKYYPGVGWTNLPDIAGNVTTVFNFFPNGFTISVLTTDGSTVPNPGTVTFRAVIISSSQKQSHPNTNWKNYDEAMKVVNEGEAAQPATRITQ